MGQKHRVHVHSQGCQSDIVCSHQSLFLRFGPPHLFSFPPTHYEPREEGQGGKKGEVERGRRERYRAGKEGVIEERRQGHREGGSGTGIPSNSPFAGLAHIFQDRPAYPPSHSKEKAAVSSSLEMYMW